MGSNLLAATSTYWRKLSQLDAAYQRGEVSLEEVDAQVKVLMAELGRARKESFRYFVNGLQNTWHEQRELLLGVSLLGVLAYTWLVVPL
ncbi:hypothetical protein JOY44_25930 (plasmid) [Phormidium sp. CLA17]|uniref:hypothetical protein n=1 Tax=Leptolyngbya sp. Cla-17 TaxID=2803751 RepID=UPI001492C3C4|nr:hypothetical protein [Leptolyngbya sp. Cla-17]MBM0744961.1 hypothetical protein [Leptolyngbya sp. Cla-17]